MCGSGFSPTSFAARRLASRRYTGSVSCDSRFSRSDRRGLRRHQRGWVGLVVILLALLPIVESAFDPFAYSHGRAAGLWQIIPGTGKRLGLTQDWWFDGRRDVLEATRAALDYLEQLHERPGAQAEIL